jgi:mannosyltransferase
MLTSETPGGTSSSTPERCDTEPDRTLLVAAGISVVAFAVILATAPHGLWLDEATSVRVSSLPFSDFVRFITDGGEPNMSLFHVLLWPIAQGHPSDGVLRGLPVAAGALALGTTFVLGRRVFGLTAAVIAIAVLAAHGYTTRYATEVRGYSLMVSLTLLGALALVNAVRTNQRKWWVLYGACAVLALFAHDLAILTVGAQLVSLFALGRDLPWRGACAVGFAVASAFIGWRLATSAANRSEGVRWIPPLSGSQIVSTLEGITGGTRLALVIVGSLVLVGLGRVVATVRRDGFGTPSWPGVLVASMAIVPIVGALAVSTVQPLFLARYFQAVLPPMALLVGCAVAALPRRPTFAIATTVVAVAAIAIGHTTLDRSDRGGSDDAAAYLAANVQPGDAVFLPYNEELGALQWYVADQLPDRVIYLRPGAPDDALTTDWWWEEPVRMGDGLADQAAIDPAEWRRAVAPFDRIWVVTGFLDENPLFTDTGSSVVPEGRAMCQQESFGTADVTLWAFDCG